MPRRLALIAAACATALVIPFATPAGAQDTTDVYVVHGLNLADQTAQSDGGSNVTVCVDGEDFIDDIEFGQVVGPIAVETGVEVLVAVYAGANVDCSAPPAVDLVVAAALIPEGEVADVIVTSLGNDSALVIGEPDVSCTEPGVGRLAVSQSSGDTGEVDVLVDGESIGTASFPDGIVGDGLAGTYSIEVTEAGTAIVGPLDQVVAAQTLTQLYVVGNVDGTSPIVPLVTELALQECTSPTTTTTVPVPTTIVPGEPVTPTPTPTSDSAAPLAVAG